MSTVETLYRSTLVTAALAASTLAAVPAAEAHEHGWREHGHERAWQPGPPRGWAHRGYREGFGYYGPRFIGGPADCEFLPVDPVAYAPILYRPRHLWMPVVAVRVRL